MAVLGAKVTPLTLVKNFLFSELYLIQAKSLNKIIFMFYIEITYQMEKKKKNVLVLHCIKVKLEMIMHKIIFDKKYAT